MRQKNFPFGPRTPVLVGTTLLGAAALAQPAAPPPFVLPPPAPVASAADQAAVPLALRRAMDTAHARWQARDGGADYHPGLTYLRDKPVLMLMTGSDEPGPKTLHRKRAIVQACGFLLDDSSFERAVVCVVELDPRKPEKPRVRNHDLRRSAFQAAARSATQSADHKEALRQARDDDGHTLRICADLGID